MAISRAVQEGDWVYVYDMNNNRLFSEAGKLQGYTSNSVSVRFGNVTYTYDENHNRIGCDY